MAIKSKMRWDERFDLILLGSFLFYSLFVLFATILEIPASETSAVAKIENLTPRFAKLILKPAKQPEVKVQTIKSLEPEKKKEEEKKPDKVADKPKKIEEKKKAQEKEVKPPAAVPKPAVAPARPVVKKPAVQAVIASSPQKTEVAKLEPYVDIEALRRRKAAALKRKQELDKSVAMHSGLLKLLTSDSGVNGDESEEDPTEITFASIEQLSDSTTEEDAPLGLWDLKGSGSAPDAGAGEDILGELDDISFGFDDGDDLDDISFDFDSGDVDQFVSGLVGEQGMVDRSLKGIKTSRVENPFTIQGYGEGESPRTEDSILLVIREYRDNIRILHNKALLKDYSVEGLLIVEFVIAPSGRVISCRIVHTSVNYPPLEKDVIKEVLTWKFAEINVDTNITVTDFEITFKIGQ